MPREATLGFRALQHVVSTPNFAARACAAQMSTDLQYCMIRPEMRRTVAVQLKESDEGGSTELHGFHFGRFAIAPCLSKDDPGPALLRRKADFRSALTNPCLEQEPDQL